MTSSASLLGGKAAPPRASVPCKAILKGCSFVGVLLLVGSMLISSSVTHGNGKVEELEKATNSTQSTNTTQVAVYYQMLKPWDAGYSTDCPTVACKTFRHGRDRDLKISYNGRPSCQAWCTNHTECDTLDFDVQGTRSHKGRCCMHQCKGHLKFIYHREYGGVNIYQKCEGR
mmetsp:Transcript_119888/g.211929  ORF Transcript_119888/g.211929 Transcript_119888/m.211929 type:complete len:172 (-) Transcript_119888:101-616(-)